MQRRHYWDGQVLRHASQRQCANYPIAELRRFVMECERSQGVLRTDQEATYTVLSARHDPAYYRSAKRRYGRTFVAMPPRPMTSW